MNKQLQEKLYKDFPNLFIQKDWPKEETGMCWGIGVEDGWYSIIRNLCECIQDYQLSCNYNLKPDDKNYYDVQFSTIKTKFGELRIYVDDNQQDSFIKGLIMAAEHMATKTCVYCGNPGVKKQNNGVNSGIIYFKPAICINCKENKGK